MGNQGRTIQEPQTVQEAQKVTTRAGDFSPATRRREQNMDAWNPPKKRLYDFVENTLRFLLLMNMGTILIMIVCLAA
jgi:hypothetical protein